MLREVTAQGGEGLLLAMQPNELLSAFERSRSRAGGDAEQRENHCEP